MEKRQKTKSNPYGSKARMQTDVERIRFAIDFAQADLKTMRRGDRQNLLDDLFLFAHLVPFQTEEEADIEVKSDDVFFARKNAAREMPDEQIERLRVQFLKILQGLSMPAGRSRFAEIGTLPGLRFYLGEGADKQTIVFAYSDDARDVVIYRLIRLLESSANTRRLQLCPECERIFLKVKRQKYCSTRCASRAYMREYRAIEGELDSNHKQYLKRKSKRIGKPADAARRPRRRS